MASSFDGPPVLLRVAAAFGVLSLPVTTARQVSAQVLFEDPLSGRLESGWEWIREDETGWKFDGGALMIRSDPGGLAFADDNKNLLVRAAPEPPFAVEVTIEFEPVEEFEQAGLVLYVDDSNYVKLQYENTSGDTSGLGITFTHETNGDFGIDEFVSLRAPSIRLRIEHRRETIRGLARDDLAAEWIDLGEAELPNGVPLKIGLVTGVGSGEAERWAGYRDLSVLPLLQ